MKVGDTAYIVESNRYVREVEIRRFSGGMFLVRFTDTGGEICGWQRVYFFVRKVKKSGTRTPWNSRRWFLAMGKIELIDTDRLTEKQARLNMEKCAEFLARMIQKYGDVVLGEIEERNAQLQGK